jgi:cyclophilin family peptidyl-prolyl cis-trans isomerase
MNALKTFLSIGVIGFLLISCHKKTSEDESLFNDPVALKILEFQDTRDTKQLIGYLKAKDKKYRALSALAFASIQDTVALPYLYFALMSDEDDATRKAAAYAIGQTADSSSVITLFQALEGETSRENQRTILEAIGKCSNKKAVEFFSDFNPQKMELIEGKLLGMFRSSLRKQSDSSWVTQGLRFLNTSYTAETRLMTASLLWRIRNLGLDKISTDLEKIWAAEKDPEVKIVLSKLLKKNVPMNDTIWFDKDFIAKYNALLNPYHKAEMLKTLQGNKSPVFEFLTNETKAGNANVVITEAAQTFVNLSKTLYGNHKVLSGFISECLSSDDPALISIACLTIIDTTIEFVHFELASSVERRGPDVITLKYLFKHKLNFLDTVRNKLSLPRDMETLVDIDKAIAYLQGVTYKKPEPAFNHPVNWEYVAKLKAKEKVKLTTNKGVIIMEWLPESAPASVANILQLVDSGFYNGKFFHRVVPDFVIQGGCPRGDGWGSLDWTQRSEFSNYLKYTRGTVGLASSGRDTEGVQFFITHCATPNLDGRYTILGCVTEGMDVVDKVVVGDRILKMERVVN